ncbi:MAG TPA: acyl-CoA dehydrogenase family protein, partial [Chloroflexota bacterium]|nr:acyl-CoA dehydrogenase family protein [Chloroflexota bacterium]
LLGDHPLARRIAAGEVLAPLVPGRGSLRLEGDRISGWADGVQFLDRARQILLVSEGRAALLEIESPLPAQRERVRVKAAEAVEAELVPMQSGVPQWRLTLESSPAPEIIELQPGRETQALTRLRTSLAAWATGAGAQAIELAVAYAKEREQFGHPIGSYQSVQNRLVDAAIQVEQGRMLVHRAAALIDTGSGEAEPMAVLARHQARKAFVQATRAAMLTFGGYAFTVDFDIQLYFLRAKEAQLAFEPRSLWAAVPGFR